MSDDWVEEVYEEVVSPQFRTLESISEDLENCSFRWAVYLFTHDQGKLKRTLVEFHRAVRESLLAHGLINWACFLHFPDLEFSLPLSPDELLRTLRRYLEASVLFLVRQFGDFRTCLFAVDDSWGEALGSVIFWLRMGQRLRVPYGGRPPGFRR